MLRILKPMLVILILGLSLKPALAQLPDDFRGETEQNVIQLPDDFSGETEHRIIHTPNSGLDIDVWINKSDGSTYYPGEDIKVYFRASRDCYVVVYDLDTRGYVNILYPYSSEDDRYVEGGRVYRIPGRYDDYSLTVDGPSGTEYIQAVVSYQPLFLPHWSDYYRQGADPADVNTLRMDENEDPYVFMEWVNNQLSQSPYYVTDVTNLYVRYPHPQWYYHPDMYQSYPDYYPYDLGSVYIWAPFAVDVYIDGIFFGIAPLTIPNFVCGRHFVSVYYHGCRLWDDYFNVESRRTVRIQTRLDQRVRYVTEDPVKKEYRNWKEKDYRLVQERRSQSVEQRSGSHSGYVPDRENMPQRGEKPPRNTGTPGPRQEPYRPDYQNRDGGKVQSRDIIPERGKPGKTDSRDWTGLPTKRQVKDKAQAPDEQKVPEKGFTSGRSSQTREHSAPGNVNTPRSEPKRQEVRIERTSRAPEGRTEVKADRGGKKR
ncbi:MAG TPA: DUF4384 domain-containing protein [Terriglobales bacterium]|nr:DUF4384 domain-containing protein [Terriglobales bacterium]